MGVSRSPRERRHVLSSEFSQHGTFACGYDSSDQLIPNPYEAEIFLYKTWKPKIFSI